MSSAQQRRNWRGILIALMVIVAVLAMIVTSVVLLTPPQTEELPDSYFHSENGNRPGSDYYYNQRAKDDLWWRRRGMRALRLSDALSDSGSIKLFNGTWISGDEMFYVTGTGDLAVMQVQPNGTVQTTRLLIPKKTLQKLQGPLVSFELSPDRNHVLVGHNAKKLYRYSRTARYTVCTVSTGQITPVTLEDRRSRNGTVKTSKPQPFLMYAQWHKVSTISPEKDKESMALIVVYRYDLFYVPWSMDAPVSDTATDAAGKNNKTADSRAAAPFNGTSSTPRPLGDKGGNSSVPSGPWQYGPVRRITTSGSGPGVYSVGKTSNGVADYLYEIEILKRSPAIWPSSGRYMLYATFDDRRVGEYKYMVYMKGGYNKDEDLPDDDELSQRQKRKRRRRRRRIRRNENLKYDSYAYDEDETSEYYIYPRIRSLRYPKANTPNPIVTLSVIVNLDQLENPQVKPKIRTLTPPPVFQYTDNYYFTAVQWVSAGGVGGGLLSQDDDGNIPGASVAEICIVWLNRAQNTSITTLCKSPLWMCQETQVINAAGDGSGGDGADGAQGNNGNDPTRRRYRRNGSGPFQKPSPSDAFHRSPTDKNNASSPHRQEDQQHHRQQQHQQHQNGHHSRRRRAGDVNGSGSEGPRTRYGGWVDATVGGAGGGVPSTGGGVIDGTHTVWPTSETATWWSAKTAPGDNENFVGDDGYTSVAGPGNAITAAGYVAAALVRRGWETGDKELTPRAPVFAADGRGYVSVAPVRDDEHDKDDFVEGGVRLRRPSPKPWLKSGKRYQSPVVKYYAQVVAVNITKKLFAPLTFGEMASDGDDGSNGKDKKKKNENTKSWTVVRILSWDQRTDMIYFLAVPSGRGAPHHRHLYAVKYTPVDASSATNVDTSGRTAYHHQTRKPVRHVARSRPICLSCDAQQTASDGAHKRQRREFGGKQDRMDEARDDRLRQQQRERWEHKQDDEDDVATAEEAERRQQRNRRQQREEYRGAIRHCTYYDAQFSRDGRNYALICLGPSVPYVTLHRIAANADGDRDTNGSKNDDRLHSVPHNAHKQSNDSSYSYDYVALLENNTRLQDKYTNQVLLPGTRTFQLRLSGGRKLTTAGGLHFNDPLSAADYYSNGGDPDQHFTNRKGPDTDPLTVAQVRLYLPLGVYDPEADPRPEFMPNRAGNSGASAAAGKTEKNNSGDSVRTGGSSTSAGKTEKNNSGDSVRTGGSSTSANGRRRRRRSSFLPHGDVDDGGDGSKRQRRKYERLRPRRFRKLYPLLVVVHSDPGSQAITDRFSDRLGYTTGLLVSGAFGKPGAGGLNVEKYGEWSRRRPRKRRGRGRRRRSSGARYYSSGYSDGYDYDQYDASQNNEYVVAVVDPGRGTWARGYESLLALNYGDKTDGFGENMNGDGPGGLLGTSDIRDQLEAVEYLLSSATYTGNGMNDDGQGYYTEDRPRGGRLSRDRPRWVPSVPMSNRRYYSDKDDHLDVEYDDIDKNDNDDYYYYYYSNGEDYSDYVGAPREDEYKDDDDGGEDGRGRVRRSAGGNSETLHLPYVDAGRVALLGGGPTTPSTPPSVYGGYATARMAMWQTIYGGAPIEKKNDKMAEDENRKEPVAIHSAFKCAITMAPVYTWRLYASAFAERYYGFYGGQHRSTWKSYDHSDLIPAVPSLNQSSYLPSSYGKGINVLVVHGTADTTIHPQHSMMLVRGVLQQQQPRVSMGPERDTANSTEPAEEPVEEPAAEEPPIQTGSMRMSQLVMPDADLSNSRMVTGIENGFPMDHHYQMLHTVYSHVTQYLATECFSPVTDGNANQEDRDGRKRKRRRSRRRWRMRDQENSNNQQRGETRDRDIDKNDSSDNFGGRFRRHDIDNSREIVKKPVAKGGEVVSNNKADARQSRDNNKTNSINGGSDISSTMTSLNNNKKISRERGGDDEDGEDEENEGEDRDRYNDDDDDDDFDDDDDDDDDDDYDEDGYDEDDDGEDDDDDDDDDDLQCCDEGDEESDDDCCEDCCDL